MDHLNKQQLTVFLGVSRVIADRLIAEGLPTVTGDRPRQSFDPAAVARWLLLRAEATGGGPGVDVQRERLLRAQADRAELELAKARGKLVCAATVARVWATTLTAARDTFRMMPRSAADRLLAAAPDGRVAFAAALLAEIDDTLRRIASMDMTIESTPEDVADDEDA